MPVSEGSTRSTKDLVNGVHWKDTSGDIISAHGGGFLKVGDYYYWFGENRHGKKKVSCYRSKDLVNWEFRNDVLTADSHPDLDPSNIERPKVIYNELTGRYVMWMHWENGRDYREARAAVASCDTVDGHYTYHRSFRPEGHMSRDCTLFKDEDGKAYFISAARENADTHIYRLTDDYMDVAAHVKTLWIGQYREAPAIIKRGRYYFLITSACTGWLPNQGKYAWATSVDGEWSELFDIGGPTTFDTQPTYILQVDGVKTTTYLYIADRWDPSDYHNSTYVFLPLEFPSERTLTLEWASKVEIDVASGEVRTEVKETGLYRIKSGHSGKYLCSGGEAIVGAAGRTANGNGATDGSTGRTANCAAVGITGWTPGGAPNGAAGEAPGWAPSAAPGLFERTLSYASEAQKWMLEEASDGFVRVKNYVSGHYVQPATDDEGAAVILSDYTGHAIQEWRLLPTSGGWGKLLNRHSGKALTLKGGDGNQLVQTGLDESDGSRSHRHPQSFLIVKVY